MANQTDVKNAIVKSEAVTTIQSMVEKSASELGRALPDHMKPERLVRIALTCIRLNPALAECTPASFLGALFTAAQIGIEPIAGRAYLLPFNNKRKMGNEWKTVREVQFVMGYKGVAELFYRHQKAIQIAWGIVKENDDFSYERGTSAYLRHREGTADRGKTVGYWAMAELQGGGKPFHYMTVNDCMEHAKKHSKSYNKKDEQFDSSSPWVKEPDSMCLKTVFVQLAKILPLSVEVQRALAADETSRDFRKEIDSALDLPVTTAYEDVEVEDAKTENGKKEEPPVDTFLESVNVLKERVDATEYDQLLLRYKISDPYELEGETKRKFLVDLGKLTVTAKK